MTTDKRLNGLLAVACSCSRQNSCQMPLRLVKTAGWRLPQAFRYCVSILAWFCYTITDSAWCTIAALGAIVDGVAAKYSI